MTDDEFKRGLKDNETVIMRYIKRKWPIEIGNRAKSLFLENFRKVRFQDGDHFERWPATWRRRY